MKRTALSAFALSIFVWSCTMFAQDHVEKKPVEGSNEQSTPAGPTTDTKRSSGVGTMTDEQREALGAHRDAIRTKHDQLNALLTNESAEYAELSAKKSKTRDERRRLIEIRRQLMQESDEVKAVINDMEALGKKFRESNPQLGAAYRAQGRQVRENRKSMRHEIDKILAEESPEFAALLSKEDKTAEDEKQLRVLRRQLMKSGNAMTKIRQQRIQAAREAKGATGDPAAKAEAAVAEAAMKVQAAATDTVTKMEAATASPVKKAAAPTEALSQQPTPGTTVDTAPPAPGK